MGGLRSKEVSEENGDGVSGVDKGGEGRVTLVGDSLFRLISAVFGRF